MLSSFITALLIKVLLLLLFFVTIITFVITAFEKNFLSNKVKSWLKGSQFLFGPLAEVSSF
jgi:uncharacterized protein involved in cysteine biosynthesis